MYTVFDASKGFYRVKADLKTLIPMLCRYGIKGINPPAEILEDKIAAKEAAKMVSDAGLQWSLLPTPADFYVVGDAEFAQGIEKLKVWAETGAIMGVRYSYNHIFPGNDEREYEENFEWHAKRLWQVQSIMKQNGILYGNEFLGASDLRARFRYPFIHTLAGQRALADAVDPDIGFVFDTFHWFCGSASEKDELSYAARHADKMVCFHMNDGVEGKSRAEQKDMTRRMPCTTGVVDAVTPYRAFRKQQYAGPVLIEPMNPAYEKFETMDAEAVVAEIAEGYRRVERSASAV